MFSEMIPFLFAFIATGLALWIFRRRQKMQLFRHNSIPGPQPSLLVGNLYELRSKNTPDVVLEKWLKKYGNIFGFFIGERPHLVVKDLDIIKQVMIKEFHNFTNRPKMVLDMKPLIYTVVALRGQRWKEVRSILTPTFSANKMKNMAGIMNRSIDTLLDVLNEYANKEQVVDMYERVQALTLDVIGHCALAMKVDCQRNPNDPFLIAVRDFFRYAHNPAVEAAVMFPLLGKLMTFINNYLTSGQMTSMIVNNVQHVINMRRANTQQRGVDILQLMLDACEEDSMDKQAKEERTKSLTDIEVVANAYVFMLAGYETTATALAFTTYLLAKHQDIQEKLHKEITDHFPEKEHLTYDDIQCLQYLDQVFSESLRIYPPVTGFLIRECSKEIIINGQIIPEGVVVQVPVWAIHHDPEFWPEPEKFDPDRFAPEKKGEFNNSAFLPFGIGPRNCIGMRFAQLEAKLTLARMIRKFCLEMCEETEDPLHLTCSTVITNPANGVYVKVRPRDSCETEL